MMYSKEKDNLLQYLSIKLYIYIYIYIYYIKEIKVYLKLCL